MFILRRLFPNKKKFQLQGKRDCEFKSYGLNDCTGLILNIRSICQVMSYPLEHKSSLRKLSFPGCFTETLRRLHAQCVTFASKKQPSPKETEVILEVIDEFVFAPGFGSANSVKTPQALVELQMLKHLVDFFNIQKESEDAKKDLTVFCSVFIFLFMEPSKSRTKASRVEVMAKLLSLAMALQSQTLLHCAAVWLHQEGPTSERSIQVVKLLIHENILLLPPPEAPKPVRGHNVLQEMKQLTKLSPLFVANFLTATCELFYVPNKGHPKTRIPPKQILSLMLTWLEGDLSLPLIAAMSSTRDMMPPGIAITSPQTPYVGLAKWTILGALFNDQPADLFSKLHLTLLESLCEARANVKELKGEVVSVRKVTLLIKTVDTALSGGMSDKEPVNVMQCLDKLGQFLQAVTAAGCLSGKTVEIISALQNLPSNKLIQMYVMKLAQV